MPKITQADVVRGAIQQLSKRGGYTAETYFAPLQVFEAVLADLEKSKASA